MKNNLTVITEIQGYFGNRYEHAFKGASFLAAHLAKQLNIPHQTAGEPYTGTLHTDWQSALQTSRESLQTAGQTLNNLLTTNQFPFLVASKCAVSYATLPILAKHHPNAKLLWIDPHGDLNIPETSPYGYVGGMIISGAAGLWETGHGGNFKLSNLVHADSRDLDTPEIDLITRMNIPTALTHQNEPQAIAKLLHNHPVYLHLDCDTLDPSLVDTEYKLPGGMKPEQIAAILKPIAHQIIGVEVTEFDHLGSVSRSTAAANIITQALEPLLNHLRHR